MGAERTQADLISILIPVSFSLKAQPKYLKCIAFTSLVLAAKINEEDEVRCWRECQVTKYTHVRAISKQYIYLLPFVGVRLNR